ncbi:MAG: hypothetical protein WA021_03380 [Minisyncoccia bacterium]
MSTFPVRLVFLGLIALMLPAAAEASFCYAQGTYYAQGSYYSQGAYRITISTSTTFTGSVIENSTLSVTSAVGKGSGFFVIDHPLDPQNKLLYHSFVESPDAKNIYDGIATLDKNGEAMITLPAYFEALNRDFRYQLRALDEAQPNLHIKSEIEDNRFAIGGGKPGKRVSWQVTGIRHDPYILANPIIPEVSKGPDAEILRGEFYFPEHPAARGFPTKRLTTYLRALLAR